MKAFVLDRYGKTTLLREGELPDPELQPDEVLVEVHATSVNPLDFKIRNGDFKLFMPARPPFALGHDVAGVVVANPNAPTGIALSLQDIERLVQMHPGYAYEDFVRGLIHSDGCRVIADDRGVKSIRYHFTNHSGANALTFQLTTGATGPKCSP